MVTRRYQDGGYTYAGKDLGAIATNLGNATLRPFFCRGLDARHAHIFLDRPG